MRIKNSLKESAMNEIITSKQAVELTGDTPEDRATPATIRSWWINGYIDKKTDSKGQPVRNEYLLNDRLKERVRRYKESNVGRPKSHN